MTRHKLTIAATSVALLLGSSMLGAQAIDAKANVGGVKASVSVGGGSGTAKASVGNTANAKATVGGGGGNVASVNAGVGNNNAAASVGTGGGPLVNSTTSGNPAGDGLDSGTSINLGNLFGGGGTGGGTGGTTGGGDGGKGGGGGGGTVATSRVQAVIADMSSGEIAAMKKRCDSILVMPAAYDSSLVELCKVLKRL